MKKEEKMVAERKSERKPGFVSMGELKMNTSVRIKAPSSSFPKSIPRIYKNKTRNIKKIMLIIDEANINLLHEITNNSEWGYQINYILTDSNWIRNRYWTFSRIYPMSVNVAGILRYDVIDEIICCTSNISNDYIKKLALLCCQYGVTLLFMPTITNQLPLAAHAHVGNQIFSVIESTPINDLAYTVKKGIEFLFSAFVLIGFSWLFALIAILIKSTSPGPVFFKQLRVGLRGRKFWIYKFRTMEDGADAKKESLKHLNQSDGLFKIHNDPRITKVGKYLRKFNLDELPQLFNVITGDMSLIGPRPMLPSEVDDQKDWQLKRFSVKPGITGLWQIQRNRNEIPFNMGMKLDKQYVENWSFANDIALFFQTIWTIISGNGR